MGNEWQHWVICSGTHRQRKALDRTIYARLRIGRQLSSSHLCHGKVKKSGLEREEAVKKGRNSDCEPWLQVTHWLPLNRLGSRTKANPQTRPRMLNLILFLDVHFHKEL